MPAGIKERTDFPQLCRRSDRSESERMLKAIPTSAPPMLKRTARTETGIFKGLALPEGKRAMHTVEPSSICVTPGQSESEAEDRRREPQARTAGKGQGEGMSKSVEIARVRATNR